MQPRTRTRIGTHIRTLALILALGPLGPLGALVPAARAQDAPKVEDVLQKIDGALLWYDRQEKLAGYDVEAVTVQTSVPRGKPAEAKPEKTAKGDRISYDAAKGTKKQTDPKGAEVRPTSFTPMCGPWTLTPIMAFEIELFARPFSQRFDQAEWDRSCEAAEGGAVRLTLTPKKPIGEPNWLKPALTGAVLDIDKDGVPTGGVLRLDQGQMQDDGKVVFQFADVKGKKRITRIENTFTSANLTITPSLSFTFGADKSGPQLPSLIEFRVPGEGLSGTMAGMDMVSFLVFRNLKVKKGK